MSKICLGENGFIFGRPGHQRFEKKRVLEFVRIQGLNGIELHACLEQYEYQNEKNSEIGVSEKGTEFVSSRLHQDAGSC
jgi:hypothetical protein